MDFSDDTQRSVFFEIHSGLPRESPGSDESTLKALSLVKDLLPEAPRIGDFACGPGSSAIPLAKAVPDAQFVAFDLYPPFIEEVERRAAAAGVSDRIDARVADLSTPPFEPQSLDMIWCEGAIYIIGVPQSLRAWRTFLKPGGLFVFNEPVWLVPARDRPADLTACWDEYPAMTDDDGVRAAIEGAGFELVGSFDMPDSDWWGAYYGPMEQKLAGLEAAFRGDDAAAVPLAEARTEIDIRRRYAHTYDYRFFATRLRG